MACRIFFQWLLLLNFFLIKPLRPTLNKLVTCAQTFWNRYLPDLINGKLDSVFAQIDLGQAHRVNHVVFEIDRVNLPPDWDYLVDVYVGNAGNRNYDTPCAVRANLATSTTVRCRREGVEATSAGAGLVHTGDDAGQRLYSSTFDDTHSKGSLTSDRGWRPRDDDVAPWAQVMLDGITDVWGIMLDSCNIDPPSGRENPNYVTKFTVSFSSTGEEGSFIPVDSGHVFRGLGFLVHEQFRRPFHWNLPVRAQFIRVHPVGFNGKICMRFDVLRAPGRVEGRYVTVYAKSKLSLCEIGVYPEVASSGSRSAMCSPRSVQSSCFTPPVTGAKYSDLSLTAWNTPDSFLRSASSVLDAAELERTGINASVCGVPRLQVRVEKGPWKLVEKIGDLAEETDPFSVSGSLQRDVPLILPSYSSDEAMLGTHTAEIRHVSCKGNPSDALSVLSEPRIFNFTLSKTKSSSSAPATPEQIGIAISAEDSEAITLGIFLSQQPSTVPFYVVIVEVHATLYFKRFPGKGQDFQNQGSALQVRLLRDEIFVGGQEGSVKVHMFGCSVVGCSTPSQAQLGIPSMQRGLEVHDTGEDPLTGSFAATVSLPSENGGAAITSIDYRVVLDSDPDVRFTFDDVLGNPAESTGLTVQNWGSGGGWGEFRGPKRPDYFPRSGAGMATSFFGGPGHQLEIKNKHGKKGMVFGPPYTVAFWIRRDSDAGACVDVMSAVRIDSRGSEVMWNYVNIFIWGHRDSINGQGNDPKAGHIVVQHQGRDFHRAHLGRVSTKPLPLGEWKYVVVRAEEPSPWETRLNGGRLQHIILTLSVLNADSGADALGDDTGVHWWLEPNPTYMNDAELMCNNPDSNSATCMPWKSPERVHRRMFLGGQSTCLATRGEVRGSYFVQDRRLREGAEDGGGAAGFGGFSLSSFTLHKRKRSPVEIIEELRHGLGYGTIAVDDNPNQDEVTFSLASHVPAKFKDRITVHTSVCNTLGCTPSISASLSTPSPPHAFNSSTDENGTVSLEFFTPLVSGGSPANDASYEYTAESINAQCNMAELILDHPDIKPYVWAYFDASEASTVLNPSGEEAKEGDAVQEWHTFRGRKERFDSSAWADSVGIFTETGNEGKPGIMIGDKEGGVLSASFHRKLPHNIEGVTKSFSTYVVASRSSANGRLVSTADSGKNYALGWHGTKVGVMLNRKSCNKVDKTKVWDTNWRKTDARRKDTHEGGWYGPDFQTRVVSAQFDQNEVYLRTDYRCRGTPPANSELPCKCDQVGTATNDGFPGRIQFGGQTESRIEPAYGEINSMLLLLPNPPKDSAHDLISAYMAWKWKKYAHWSDAEKSLFSGSNGCIFPDSTSSCHMSLDTVEGAPSSSCVFDVTSRVFFPGEGASAKDHFSRAVGGNEPSDIVYAATHWRVATKDPIINENQPVRIKGFDLRDVGGSSLLPVDLYDNGVADANCAGVKAKYLHIRGEGQIILAEIQLLGTDNQNILRITGGGWEKVTQSSLADDDDCEKGGQCDTEKCVDGSLVGFMTHCKTHSAGAQWILLELKEEHCIKTIKIFNRQDGNQNYAKRKWITLWRTKYEDPPAWEVTTSDCKARATAGDETNPCEANDEPDTYEWTLKGRSQSLTNAETKGLLHSGWYDPLNVAYSDHSREQGPQLAIDGDAGTKWCAAGIKTERHLAASTRTKSASVTYPVEAGGIWMGFAFETPQAVHSATLDIEGTLVDPGLVLQRSTDGGISWQSVGQVAAGSNSDTVAVTDVIPVQLPNSVLKTQLQGCNRFGCGGAAEITLRPPPPATFVSVEVVSDSKLSIKFRVPSAEMEKKYGSSSQSFKMYLGHSFPTNMANLIKSIDVPIAQVDGATGIIPVDVDADGVLWDATTHKASETRLWLRIHTCSVLGCSDDYAESSTGPPSMPSQLRVSIAGDHSVNVKIGYPRAENGLPASKYSITATVYNSSVAEANEKVKTITEELVPTGLATVFVSGGSINRVIDLTGSVLTTQRVRIEASACSSLGCTLLPATSWNVDMNMSISPSFLYDRASPDSRTLVPTLSWSTAPDPAAIALGLTFTDPLELLFRFSVNYESDTGRTLKRMSNYEFLAIGADFLRAPAVVHAQGKGIWGEATQTPPALSAKSNDLAAGTVLYEVFVSVPGTYELHAYTRCPDSDHNSWQVITQEGIVVRWDMATVSEGSASKSTWNIFSGGKWTIDYPGKNVWVELRVDEPECLIERLLFNLEDMENQHVRGRVWPPPVGTVIMQSYESVLVQRQQYDGHSPGFVVSVPFCRHFAHKSRCAALYA